MPPGVDAGESQTDRGVSPVIAVVLMVGVVLVLAAVVGAFVFVLGDEAEEPAPTVSTELDRAGDEVSFGDGAEQISIGHESGENIPVSELRIIVEAECFDDDLLVDEGTKRGELVNLPLSAGEGAPIDEETNVEGDNIFQNNPGALSSTLLSEDGTWTAGEQLTFEIDDDACGVQSSSQVTIQAIHEPSNSRIVEESSGSGVTPVTLGEGIEPATPNAESTHTWVLEDIEYGTPGNDGDEVDEITVDYDPNGDQDIADLFLGSVDENTLNQEDVAITMTRTLSGGTDRSEINLINEGYSGKSATFELDGQTDVAGAIEIEIEGIRNPPSADSFDVEITLDGDAGEETFERTLETEGEPAERQVADPATGGENSTHTWLLDLVPGDFGEAGNDGNEVDEITVDYPDTASFGGLDNDDITVTMTRTRSDGLNRSTISVNNDEYDGSEATFDLSGSSQTDVAGAIEIEIDGIENPPDADDYNVEFTLDDGDGLTETVTDTLEIESGDGA